MNQATWIAASIIVGFIVFITVNGELPDYIAVISGQPSNDSGTASTGTAPASAMTAASSLASLASGLELV